MVDALIRGLLTAVVVFSIDRWDTATLENHNVRWNALELPALHVNR
jgi:hypothetical protein